MTILKLLLALAVLVTGICMCITSARIKCDDSHDVMLKTILILVSLTYIVIGVGIII